ncbi:uncharacterized protein QC763_706420 [Podospora pseudopauciseta]|uniref:E3 ubiquitin-protein ligase DMA2 n=1 Tax=Podospora pseudopauciseta TaxID=2093780 RepID=A0ABR0H0U6_9PEZI|nr:hypothetical protein QC763_706420 [Podospora pseudopauciseta]
MFTQPVASPTSPGAPVSPGPVSPTRTSRLRGLSYFRNYTQNHLLSREHSAHAHAHAHTNQSHQQHHQANSPTHNPSLNSPALPSPGLPIPPPTAEASSHYNHNNITNATTNNTHGHPSHTSRSNPFLQPAPTLAQPLVLPPSTTSQTSSGLFPGDPLNSALTERSGGVGGLAPPANTTIMTRARSATVGDAVLSPDPGSSSADILPSIRFSAFHDTRATRPSLKFPTISRTLPTGNEVIRVGRYSERDNQPNIPSNMPSAAPVGFKSKVVSRRHCEFWYEDGKWYIKDVKSSSGTFLNHIRLSPPGTESKPFAVNDGDIVQLGIDFKGGEEMIFRCVKMRLELNRGWQNKLNAFNLTSHKRLRNMTAGSAQDSSAQSYTQDCSICLNSIAPCQSLFVAPCSHTWHFKCIRALLNSPSYPIFICPNCRAAADLEAEVEDPEEWEQLDSDEGAKSNPEGTLLAPATSEAQPRKSRESVRATRQATLIAPQQPPLPIPVPVIQSESESDVVMVDVPAQQQQQQAPPVAEITLIDTREPTMSTNASRPPFQHAQSSPVPIHHASGHRTPSPTGPLIAGNNEGPITPRNDAGPWVFDGSGLRQRADGGGATAQATKFTTGFAVIKRLIGVAFWGSSLEFGVYLSPLLHIFADGNEGTTAGMGC